MVIGAEYFSSVQQQCELIEQFATSSERPEDRRAVRLISKRGSKLIPQMLERAERLGCRGSIKQDAILHPPNPITGESIFIVYLSSEWLYPRELQLLRESPVKWYLMYDYFSMGFPDSVVLQYFLKKEPLAYSTAPMERVFPLL